MCGLAVIVAEHGHVIPFGLTQRMDRCLAHRGPDGFGLLSYDCNAERVELARASVALMHRRLAIIDPAPRSNQPMISADGRYALILNGEIYNYLELREILGRFGHRFRTASDAEVLLAAFAQWRQDALPRLIGMFAFVVLDCTRRELFVARDPFGIKPLFWAHSGGMLAFASEIRALLELPELGREPDLERVALFLADGRSDHGEKTMFANVSRLPAATFATVSLDRPSLPQPQRYWRPAIVPRAGDLDENARALRALLLESVKLHIRSDVPIGYALSGGLDSSTILACAREVGGRGLRLRSFSFLAAGSDLDESAYVCKARAAVNAENDTVRIDPGEIINDIDRLIDVQGEPFGSISTYAQYRLMQLAAGNSVKVMLGGQGADELFGGYRPYFARRLSELLRHCEIGTAFRLLQAIRALPDTSRLLVMQALEPAVPSRLRGFARGLLGKPVMPLWVNLSWFERRGILVAPSAVPKGRHFLHNALVQSLEETVLPALLRYEDRNSMAFSLESRLPFLTPALADFAYSLPSEHLISNDANGKQVLRCAMRGMVPEAILDRRDKIGFATPDRLWARSLRPWLHQVLASEPAQNLLWLDAPKARRSLDRHLESHATNFNSQFWRTITLIRWVERYKIKIAG